MRHRCISVQVFVFIVTASTFFFIVQRYILFRLCAPTRAFLSAQRWSLRWHCSVSSATEKRIPLSRGDSKRPACKVIVIARQPCPNLIETLQLMIVWIMTWKKRGKKASSDQRVDVNETFVRDCSTFGWFLFFPLLAARASGGVAEPTGWVTFLQQLPPL